MSLVERALKKMQEARVAGAPEVPAARTGAAAAETQPARHDAAPAQRPVRQPPPSESVRPSRVVRIDRAAMRAAEILPPLEQERQLADEYRQIKRPLIANALGRGVSQIPNGHLIMLASAMPGDGKTFTSINLALSMALEKDVTVLLIDADVAKPHISKLFDLESEQGLLDVLRDEHVDVESVILPTDVPGLSVLPAGKRSETATELLASARMQHVVAQIGARDPNRIVLLDSPPLLLTSESRALASVVGQIVLVVRAGFTPQQAVFDTLELLGEGKSIGLVLNQSDDRSRAGYYRYYGPEGEAEGSA